MNGVQWEWRAASVRGFDHEEASLPCQDAHAVRISRSGHLIAVVSDGAGSAKYSQDGSRLLCDDLSVWLTQRIEVDQSLTAASLGTLDVSCIRSWVEEAIDGVRWKLVARARELGADLSDYHATLVGVIADESGGAFFHIGDGAALAENSTDPTRFSLSPAENGEYANETFFFTQEDWRERLRISKFDSTYDLVTVMTDGVTPVALNKGGRAPFGPFLEPVTKFLSDSDQTIGNTALEELLTRNALRRISGDDKTLVWARRVTCD